ncbi:NUDIX domain-containing protein [Gilvimarinus sp. SDUM040013]|uniref:NUDIX domain-containing protein n=1 Tax=Gilvimarinus gilvus TaxID=3058038 RepID=A0ABU4S0R9_9GAMM|nr:NUDIX domain-containing protein [Gilvimarinus sp. SDUM040013]MDO3384597.1 NUDIX domain-containing protein [Gilvimarinus sp. SDUM040013]MDX6850067.1 NUDIX domain-containing protein [Gilvimarinus sp. SDUM040013]
MKTPYLHSVDNVVFGYNKRQLYVLVTQYLRGPLQGQHALPGDWLHPTETLEQAAERILKERTGLESATLKQYYTFSALNRHPSERAIGTAFWMITHCDKCSELKNNHDVCTQWYSLDKVPTLIFDHTKILNLARRALKSTVSSHPMGRDILPVKFTIGELIDLYETLLDIELDAPNFRRKLQRNNLLTATQEKARSPQGRLSTVYTFNSQAYETLAATGLPMAFSA